MARHPLWKNGYWLLLLQQYLKKPIGVKPLYSRDMVKLALELHISPEFLHEQMFKLRMETPPFKRLWNKYENNPRKLTNDIRRMKELDGYGNAQVFYEGVEVNETFEKDWSPIREEPSLTPVKLIIILDLYFQLTPLTMVVETPEVIDLGKLLAISPKVIVEVMRTFQCCDPYLNKNKENEKEQPLQQTCMTVWKRFGNGNPDRLYQYATELKEYFK